MTGRGLRMHDRVSGQRAPGTGPVFAGSTAGRDYPVERLPASQPAGDEIEQEYGVDYRPPSAP